MQNDNENLQRFLSDHPDVEMVEMVLPDLAGRLRGKWVTRDKLDKLFGGRLKLPLSALVCDIWGRDVEELVFPSGDGDGYCTPDSATLVATPWHERAMGQVLISMSEVDGSPCRFDSRHILRGLMARFDALGLTPVVATEMEFYVLGAEDDPLGRPLHTQADRVGGTLAAGDTYSLETMAGMSELMHGIRDACEVQRLPIDTLVKEAAPSQYEINLYHSPDALQAADQAVMLKRAIRGVAAAQGLRATFMAKPFGDLAGNGMHVHCSLLDRNGENAFSDGGESGTALLRHAVAGCLESMADSMLLFAPNLNSYRRFQRGTHAPMAPCWGYENRTTSVRIPADSAAATRIEHRVAGADANPYLVIAGVLGAMLRGIEQKLEAPQPIEGNAYDLVPPSLPRHWPLALARLENAEFIRDYFGAEFQHGFTTLKHQELDEFDRQVTPLEYDACL